jgi:serine-type D-Ala-D-Ala carboxypeptidase/endopeptidase (penicillin-binding protein 4)
MSRSFENNRRSVLARGTGRRAHTRAPRASASWLLLATVLVHCSAMPLSSARADSRPGARTPEAELADRIRESLRTAALGERVGISVVDLRGGRPLYTHNPDLPLRPASNVKLLTAAACLLGLGAEFRIPTAIYGELAGGAVSTGLYLKGYGDPTLSRQDLYGLAVQLAARGVKRVNELVIDGSHFDAQTLPPGFQEQPHEFSAFRAAVAALSVDENAYTLEVSPGPRAGSSARVTVTPAGHFSLTNHVSTSARGKMRVVMDQKQQGDKLAISVSGSIPAKMATVGYRRRVEAPLAYAAAVMVEALRAVGIQVPSQFRVAAVPAGKPLLVVRQSPPLSQMLSMVGKYSDNFVAEMLLKVLAAERRGPPAHSSDGAMAALETLGRLGLPAAQLRMVNGSGLFGDNSIAANHFTQVLAGMYADPAVRTEFVAQLAVGGVDGTLSQRLTTLPSARIVRAKTGTLDDVISLSGYVLGRTPERTIAFSILVNGARGRQSVARTFADETVRHIANYLWLGQTPPSREGE